MRRVPEFRPIFHVDRRLGPRRHGRGFTLVEMIIAIVITGILVGMVGIFGRQQMDAYFDISNRAELSDAADTALRRVARDLQAALPNSVRQSGNFLEFVPIVDAGRYRADVGAGASDDPLDFTSNSDTTFDVLGPPVKIRSGEELVIFNLGQPGSDVYETGTSRRAATAGTNLPKVTFDPAGTQFSLASPQSRFQIAGRPVTYECAPPNVLRHRDYDFSSTQPTSFSAPAQSDILVSNVAGCAFSYTPAVLQRNGLVVLKLKLTINGESVELMHQVDVLNTP